MLVTKILAVVALISWLGATGERLYDCWLGETRSGANLEQFNTERLSFSHLRW